MKIGMFLFGGACLLLMQGCRSTDTVVVLPDEAGTLSWSIAGNFDTYELPYREWPIAEVADANTPFTLRTAAGTRARKASLQVEKLLKEFRKVSVEEAKN